MNRLKAFIYTLKNSLVNISYYKDLLSVSTKFSIKYVLMLGIIATVISTLNIAIPLIPGVKETVDEGINYIRGMYPEDLVITTKEGEWSINQPEPYAIPTPDFMQMNKESIEKYDINEDYYYENIKNNLIVFDHDGTINDLDLFNTYMLLNRANLIVVEERGRMQTYPVDSFQDIEINNDMYQSFIDNIAGLTKYVPTLIVSLVLIGTVFYYIVYRLIYLLVVALWLFAIGKIKRLDINYKDYYKISAHTMTLPLLLELIFALTNITVSAPLWFFGLNLVFGIVIIFYLENDINPKKADN